ncbi:MAG TPA: LCP family protein, partial [Candidatus Sulfotelmatobacter sp.]|nr:LCP family protein [Candidatus Sulfotelmatobacter sp.]
MPDRSINRKRNSKAKRPTVNEKVLNKQAASFPVMGANLSGYGNGGNATKFAGAAYEEKVPKRKRFFSRKTLKRSFISVLIAILIIGGYVGGKFAYNLSKTFNGNIFGLLFPTKLNGEDSGHVNILLAGYSADDPNHQGAELTDSIMLVSIDTQNNTASMLSIPRDLWVNIPGNGYNKINAAYEDGQADNFSASGYPNGGMGQLEQIVSQKLGIPIDYYGLIDYTAFKDSVNAVGGIRVDIQSSDPRGLYDAYTHLNLPN